MNFFINGTFTLVRCNTVDGKIFDDHYHFGIGDQDEYKKIIEKDYFIFVERKTRRKTSLHHTRKTRRVHSKNKYYNLSDSLEEVNPTPSFVKIRPTDKYVFFHKTTQHLQELILMVN